VTDIYYAIVGFIELGGNVVYFIAATTFLMWTLLFERIWYFFFEHEAIVGGVVGKWNDRAERTSWSARAIRTSIISETRQLIRGSLPLILTCITLCPLLGLLGTVTGMISVFDAMASQGGNARSMAAGVSQATIPTMCGMIASLTGIMGSTFVRRKIDQETELLADHLTLEASGSAS
ncbi:uncharacterized protein METZ01_LOCUS70262, partial [marine metagenome]|jgi:biopolymer transport protein ExbB|tara:strand:+ start:2357 stop:2887 length:531 start_codon:yes stop_codon:yes gene_type:complete